MKTPVCEICLKSGILCRSCEDKVKGGSVSETEVKVAGLLLKLSEEKKIPKDVSLKRVLESPKMVVIVCGKGDTAKFIGAGGHTVKRLEKEISKRIMIVEESSDMKEFISNLVKPARVVSTSTVYKDGEEVMKVVVSKGGQRISSDDFNSLMNILYGKSAEIAGE